MPNSSIRILLGAIPILLYLVCLNNGERVYFWDWVKFQYFFNNKTKDVISLSDFEVTPGCKECPRVYLPVCADNNVTYTSECKMKCANLKNLGNKRKPQVKKVRMGQCVIFDF